MKPDMSSAPSAFLIAGATASGKSALALAIAEAFNGVIINADSMQVYDTLQVLTARPDAADLARVPHYLYGHVSPQSDYSVGHWVADAAAALAKARANGQIGFHRRHWALFQSPATRAGGYSRYSSRGARGLARTP